jgi:dolichyl-phosphate beta-glucosyltransferase
LHSVGPSPRVSLVLPCYNGGGYVAESLATLHAWLEPRELTLGPFEVILVDDGSTDGTRNAAVATGLPFRLVRHRVNRGKGAAVRSGMLQASGRFQIFMDADLPFDLDALERMLYYLDFKEFDACIGSRATRESAYAVARPAARRLASTLFTELVGRLVVTGVRDTQCGIKGFRAHVARYLFGQSRVNNFAFDVELLYLAFKNGFDVKTIPVRLAAEKPSSVRVTRDGLPMLLEVMKLPLRFHRGEYALYDGRESAWGEAPATIHPGARSAG